MRMTNVLNVLTPMKIVLPSLVFSLALLAAACGTSSNTTTGPSLDRCAITVSNSTPTIGPSGGSGRLTVVAGRECTWSVTSSVPWITPGTTGGGQGDGSVDYVVAANPTAESRRGTVNVGGQIVEVVQEALTCRFNLQPASENVGAEGGSGSFTVEAATGCTWTPSPSEEWITVANTDAQNGNGSVSYTIARNTGGPRNGSISIGGQPFTILQSAPACRYQLSAIAGSFSGAGGAGSVTVAAAGACTWTASTNVPWISIVGETTGAGNGTINFTVQANPGPARNGILTIGGQRFTVTQLQAQCSYAIAPADQSFPVTGGQGAVSVTTSPTCSWNTSDVPVWITGMPAAGMGSQTIAYTVAANPGAARTAAIVIGGQSFAVNQAAGCSYSLAPTSHNPASAGGAGSFAVNTAADCAWTSAGVPSWITGIPASGIGPQAINFIVAANAGAARTATFTVGGQTFTVAQAGAACSYSLNPASHNAAAGGGSGAFDVNTTAGCEWTSSGVPDWITGVPQKGSGPQRIDFTVAANSGGARSATITIGGQTFTVTQGAAAVCSYSLDPTSHNASAAGGSGSFNVNTSAGCAWNATGVPGWITGIPTSGSGTTAITFAVAANTGAPRNANIAIGGQTFAVTQAGCTYSLSPGNLNFDSSGTPPRDITVTTDPTCAWTATGDQPWIKIVSGGTGPGNGTIKVTLDANSSGAVRQGNIDVAGQKVTITQNP